MKLIAAPSGPAFYATGRPGFMSRPAHARVSRSVSAPTAVATQRTGALARDAILRARNMFLLGQTVGKYQILANLGSGGFGTVFLARDAWIDKKVAIKVPHRQTGEPEELLQEPR